jgi:hypothetical protein
MSVCCVAALLLTALLAGIAEAQSVLTYHADPGRSGRYVVPALSWTRARDLRRDTAFAPRFSGDLYAQPLYWQPAEAAAARLLVATEDDVVAAIDAGSGKTLWTRRLGRPVPLSALACGNIDPLGITGTPVIDAASEALYLDAMIAEPTGPHHLIFALSIADGAPLPGWPVDVGAALAARGLAFHARYQNQRGALAIVGGRVFVPYGGHFGDCGDYRGWIVGVALANPSDIVAWHTSAPKGGIWAPGGIVANGQRLIFATGNTEGARRWGGGEAVFRLTPDLAGGDRTPDFFAAADWRALDAADADLGGTNPMPLDVPAGDGIQPVILALGKDGRAYLLDRDNLGGVGGQLRAETVSTGPIRTAPAAYPVGRALMVAFEGAGADCPDHRTDDVLTVLRIAAGRPPALATAWCGALEGRGAPIVTTTDGHSNPIVWILGAEGDNRLHGFRGDSGAVLFDGGDNGRLPGLRHFGTLLATPDRLYIGADRRLYAFSF